MEQAKKTLKNLIIFRITLCGTVTDEYYHGTGIWRD